MTDNTIKRKVGRPVGTNAGGRPKKAIKGRSMWIPADIIQQVDAMIASLNVNSMK